MKRIVHDQRGVAMITVLFVAAVLTVVASSAGFITVQELRSTSDDRRGAQATAYAEAGIDRMMLYVKGNAKQWQELVLPGCTVAGDVYDPVVVEGSVGDLGGTYSAELRRRDPCPSSVPSVRRGQVLNIVSVGSHPTARRTIQQSIRISGTALPIGISAQSIDANGSPSVQTISMVSSGNVIGRDKLAFTGTDPYYEMSDFYPTRICPDGVVPDSRPQCVPRGDIDTATDNIPAAVHATGSIIFSKAGAETEEHPPSPNCDADKGAPSSDQSAWDGSATGIHSTDASGVTTPGWNTTCSMTANGIPRPPSTKFTESDRANLSTQPGLTPDDHLFFRDAARNEGIYCRTPASGTQSCTVGGVSRNLGGVIGDNDILGLPRGFVVFVEYDGGDAFSNANTLNWSASTPRCSTDPTDPYSIILIVKNGSLKMAQGSSLTGAVFVEDGQIDSAGVYTIEGTIVAHTFHIRGNAEFLLTDCWLRNMPGAFLVTETLRWSEIDR